MSRQHPYGGYGAPPSVVGQPPPSQPQRNEYAPQQLSADASAPFYTGPAYPAPYGGPPPPAAAPQRDDRGPPSGQGGYGTASISAIYGPPIHFDGGNGRPPPPLGAGNTYGSANQFEPNYGMPNEQPPQMRPYGESAPSFAPTYGENRAPPHGSGGRPPPAHVGVSSSLPYSGNAGSGHGGGGASGGFQPRKRSRADEDGGDRGDMSYQTYLHERLKRERPCRTLFVRNIDFKADVAELRRNFESFGELKSWFDLIQKRGIAFISYYDIRAAEAAREALQGYVCVGRELDVHFSLPRETEMTQRCSRDKDQGSLSVTLKNSPMESLSIDELRSFFSRFGELRNVRDYNEQPGSRLVEFFDCRATKAAYDQTVGTQYRGGSWDVSFAWDLDPNERLPDMQKHERDKERLRNIGYQPSDRERGDTRERGGRNGPHDRGSFEPVDNGYGQPPPPLSNAYGGPPQHHAGTGTKRGLDQSDGGAEPPMRRWGQPAASGPARAADAGYGPRAPPPYGNPPGPPPPGGPPSYNSPPVAARPAAGPPSAYAALSGGGGGGAGISANNSASPAGNDAARLEQAQKVQQLLASLKPAAINGATNRPPPTAPPQPQQQQSPPAPPTLPSSLAALLQMAQSKNAGGQPPPRH